MFVLLHNKFLKFYLFYYILLLLTSLLLLNNYLLLYLKVMDIPLIMLMLQTKKHLKKFLKIISRQKIIRADTPIKGATIGHMFFVTAESCWLHVFTSDLGCRCLPILFFQNRTDNQLHRLRPHCSQRSSQVSSQCEQKNTNQFHLQSGWS